MTELARDAKVPMRRKVSRAYAKAPNEGENPSAAPTFAPIFIRKSKPSALDRFEDIDAKPDVEESKPFMYAEDSGISVRRKALAQVAFVRYETTALFDVNRRAAAPQQSYRQSKADHKFPGDLCHHDEPIQEASSSNSPGEDRWSQNNNLLPSISRNSSGRQKEEGPLLFQSTLNGMGHPSLTLNSIPGAKQAHNSRSADPAIPKSSYVVAQPSELSEEDVRQLANPSRTGKSRQTVVKPSDDGIAILLRSPHWQAHQGNLPTSLINAGAGHTEFSLKSESSHGGPHHQAAKNEDESKTRQTLKRMDSLLPAGPREPPPVVVRANAKPVENDTLNLWKGKRLTRSEMKVEQKLHVLRHNPVAKTELRGRVDSYVQDRVAESQEKAAMAEFAAERREQKTVLFVLSRFKPSGKEPIIDLPTALFDSNNGMPRNDCNPLPPTSEPFWIGHVTLIQKLNNLKIVLERKRLQKKNASMMAAAAETIQRFFRGFKDRARLQRERAEAARALCLQQERELAEAQAGAAQKVLQFLEFAISVNRKVTDKAAAVIWSKGEKKKNLQKDFDMFRRIRLEVLLSQWTNVEIKCIDLAKKRQRSMIIGELQEHQAEKSGATSNPMLRDSVMSRKKGSISNNVFMGDEDMDDHIKKEVTAALYKTFTSDRILNQNYTPVPKPVKVAVLHVFMEQRLQAYVALIGLYWKEKTRRIVSGRAQAVKDAAMRAVRGDESVTLPPAQTEDVAAIDRSSMTAAAAASAALKGALPRYRMFASLPELKVLMQQGVAENPSFQAYLVRGGLQAYEQQIAKQMADDVTGRGGINSPVSAMAKLSVPLSSAQSGVFARQSNMPQIPLETSSFRMLEAPGMSNQLSLLEAPGMSKQPSMLEAPGMSRQPSMASNAASASADSSKSFTLTLLMHRWDRECKPRIKACIQRRFQLMHLDLVDCLLGGLWLGHDEMGAKLLELRDG
ncbi:hypothetical protein CEUSTIGMA_g4983.t1 [Chlamydomonas eustigma]|uniref:Uncharacterized protein n=1 Tax=Chlamydomonas eustigma TaxID=1157962 RepID=A0A250X3P3_9CHLO|nr:hypothetical protein CEUSTIGMA_g4983.t1 [Chlamydomonas eustigma]|eukprot:GAX77539.1 hypothetical protein CEUSTIGMA_g4983.t1 [Chlamydomonas eustigma]